MPQDNSRRTGLEPQRAAFDAARGVLRACQREPALELLTRLASGPMDVGSLARALELKVPTVSRELASLRSAGLAEVRKAGNRRVYSLSEAIIARHRGETCRILIASPGRASVKFVLPAAPPSIERGREELVINVPVGQIHRIAAKRVGAKEVGEHAHTPNSGDRDPKSSPLKSLRSQSRRS